MLPSLFCWCGLPSLINLLHVFPSKLRAIPDDVILSTGLHNRYWVLDVQEVVSHKGDLEKHLKITASKIMHPTESCVLKEGW